MARTRTSLRDYEMEDTKIVEAKNDEVMSPTKKGTTVPKTVNGKVCNADFVNIRSGPSKETSVLAILKEGEDVEILDKVDDFYKVRFNNVSKKDIGFIFSDFCKEV